MYISAKFKTGVKILQNHVQCKVCAFVEKDRVTGQNVHF